MVNEGFDITTIPADTPAAVVAPWQTITAEEVAKIRFKQSDSALRASRIPKILWGGFASYQVNDANRAVFAKCLEWSNQFPNVEKGLALSGVTGCGKSHLAAAICLVLLRRGFKFVWWNTGKLQSRLIDAMNRKGDISPEDLIDEATETPLLVLDDFGEEMPTQYAVRRLYDIINGRLENGKPIIATTNYKGEALISHLSGEDGKNIDVAARIRSRLVAMCESAGVFPAVDYRILLCKSPSAPKGCNAAPLQPDKPPGHTERVEGLQPAEWLVNEDDVIRAPRYAGRGANE